MPSGTRKSKCTFRGIVAPEPISASELGIAESILARFVALAYAGDHQDLFSSKADAPEGNASRNFGHAPGSAAEQPSGRLG